MSKADPSRRVNIILRQSHYEALVRRSAETGAPLSELIRRLIEASVAGKQKGAK